MGVAVLDEDLSDEALSERCRWGDSAPELAT